MEELEEVVAVASNYFESLFHAGACDQMEECLATIPQMVTEEMKETLSGEFTTEEVKVALFQMGPIKVPRPNGMNALFFQKF